MSNACFFEMKIAGEESGVREFAKMMEGGSIGQVTAFKLDRAEAERGLDASSAIALTGSGSCVRSARDAMIANDGPVDLHSETERLGLVVEIFSAEPSTGFQEHLIMDKGDLVLEETADYQEIFIEWGDDGNSCEVAEEMGITEEELDSKVNEYGELWIGGFEGYGQFRDLVTLLGDQPELIKEPLESAMQQARERAHERNANHKEKSQKSNEPER